MKPIIIYDISSAEHHISYVLAVAPNNQARLGIEEGLKMVQVDD